MSAHQLVDRCLVQKDPWYIPCVSPCPLQSAKRASQYLTTAVKPDVTTPERKWATSQGKQACLQKKLEVMSLFCPLFSLVLKPLLPLALSQQRKGASAWKKPINAEQPNYSGTFQPWAFYTQEIQAAPTERCTWGGGGFLQLFSTENWSNSELFIYKHHEERLSVFSELFSTEKFKAPYWIFFLFLFLSSLTWECWWSANWEWQLSLLPSLSTPDSIPPAAAQIMGRELLLPVLPLTALPSPAAVPPLITSGMHLVALEKGPQQQQQCSTSGGTSTGRAGGVEDEAPQSHRGSWAGTSQAMDAWWSCLKKCLSNCTLKHHS